MGLIALLRNEGGSFGGSMVQTIEERRNQFHTARADDFLDPLNSQVTSFLQETGAVFYQQTGDPAGAQQIALQALEELRKRQTVTFAFLDVFWVAAVVSLGLVFLVFLMKRSVAKTTPNQK